MRKPSYATLAESAKRLQSDLWTYQVALNLILDGPPDAEERFSDPCPAKGLRSSYRLRLYGSTRADGGTVLVTFRCAGSSDYHTVANFDAYREGIPQGGVVFLPMRIALDRLAVAREVRAKLNDCAARY